MNTDSKIEKYPIVNGTGDEEQWIGNPPAYPTDNVEVHSVYRLNIDGFCVNLVPHPTSMVLVPKYGKGLAIAIYTWG